MTTTTRIELPIPGFTRWRVRSDGKIIGPRGEMAAGRWRVGYPTVRLTADDDGRREYRTAHRVVADRFLPVAGDTSLLVVRHLDGTKHNNDPANLAWGTPADNARDAVGHGVRFQPNQRAPSEWVEMIRRWEAGECRASIAREYGVHPTSITNKRSALRAATSPTH